ncbi:serine hydrolase domain-containing protein [Amycolatopsis vastitatis]|uniref:Serine hydrolase n=1 Tax=Amycolatopsis vastitatis TaxID=1905142 RepID=A0A229SL04_9PSEU|nr:serine hydrolase domain-containing protein [Amycolatopsis vastitatis]OXM59612.1 serine hydrolase [Amycolatopsis vastitatis]
MKRNDAPDTLSRGAEAAFPGGSAGEDSRGKRLQELLDAERDAGLIGAFAQVRDGDLTRSLVTGVADVTTGEPPRADFRHRVGGVIKSFVAVVVLRLAGEGRLDLDAPVGRYLPEVVPGDRGRRITVRMLLNHTSGIGDYLERFYATTEKMAEAGTRTFTPLELVRMGLAMPPTGPAGDNWSYANTNYIILGLLIERITGRPYGDELRERVLGPLGLTGTSLPGTDPGIRGPHQRAYLPMADGSVRDCTSYHMSAFWAAGELISTAADVNTFYRALLRGEVLEPGLLREMKDTVPFSPKAPDAGGYGLGILWFGSRRGRMWGHNGLAAGHTTYCSNSEDATTQVTLAETYNLYEPLGSHSHPITTARQAFTDEVMSGSED